MPVYGTRIESTPSSAVPDRAIAHDGTDGVDAVAFADHAMVDPLIVPWAVPLTFRSPAQVALNAPFAVVAVISVGVHLKFVQLDGDGTMLVEADVHVPIRALTPPPLLCDGPVIVLVCSNPKQPDVAKAAAAAITHANRCLFIEVYLGSVFAGVICRGPVL